MVYKNLYLNILVEILKKIETITSNRKRFNIDLTYIQRKHYY